jgi:hypothetical protein
MRERTKSVAQGPKQGILVSPMWLRTLSWLAFVVALLLTGCASDELSRVPEARPLTPSEARGMIAEHLPPNVPERMAWATDMYAAFTAMQIPVTPENVCAVVAITEQESSFRVDPAVPGLSSIAWKEIDRQAERAGVPMLAVRAALLLPSPNGKSYSERIDGARTEKQLSDIFEDFIGMVPLGKTFFADHNPVRTGGPMQVSIAYAEWHAADKPYPYPVSGSIRHEVFTRRGGLYFGIAHLLDYPASYDSPIYRFADFNAGHYASRNAAFQRAVSTASGIPLALDGDLLRYERGRPAAEAGETEVALRTLAKRLDLTPARIRRDLESAKAIEFEKTQLYARVFALAEKATGKPVARAVLPQIELKSPKITRKLTTEWFANRVATRYRACLVRGTSVAG